jgi:hypothetical protein
MSSQDMEAAWQGPFLANEQVAMYWRLGIEHLSKGVYRDKSTRIHTERGRVPPLYLQTEEFDSTVVVGALSRCVRSTTDVSIQEF